MITPNHAVPELIQVDVCVALTFGSLFGDLYFSINNRNLYVSSTTAPQQ